MVKERAKERTTPSDLGAVNIAVIKGDPDAFGSLVEPYRRELQLHCYRLLGSLHVAEDLVQETMLRAWQHVDTFAGRASLRTWLYAIATNACLDALKKHRPRTLPVEISPAADPHVARAPAWAESTWLEPFPDIWLADIADEPEARYTSQESVSLAFLTAIQLLPPRQRAVLLLKDVLDWDASEIGSLLTMSVSAVRSALHRARVTLSKHYHIDERERTERLRADPATQKLLDRYLHAWETKDVAALVALMTEDASFTMPPSPSWYGGREAIRIWISGQAFDPLLRHRFHFFPAQANGQTAFAFYRSSGADTPLQAVGIQILTVEAGATGLLISDVTTYLAPSLLRFFDFPLELADC
jgi:RNA polymerase sigma-70 factor, ECF subfamily